MIKSYINNLKFSCLAAGYMLFSICFVLLNGLLPFFPVPKLFNIEAIARKIKKLDAYSRLRKLK